MTPIGVDVTVLGPVTVRGVARPFQRPASRELVVFLALHRHGASQAACALALWPDRPVCPATVHSTVSDARRALGRDPDGTPHLPRGSHLRLGESVTSDVERFAALAASDDPDDLVRAMRLVRGPLFTGLRRTDWAVFDGTASAVECQVVGTALRGARALLRRGDPVTAEWTVRRALTLSRYDERLYRALLRATAAQGDRLRLRATMAELRILAGEPLGTPGPRCRRDDEVTLHPRTRDLYRELLEVPPGTEGYPARL